MAKRLQNNDVIGLVGTSASEWIQEIQAGETTHAIAVKHGIKFFNGSQDTTGVEWDGVQDLEVIIPTLADIVSNPVTLKGVIDAAENIPSSASNGDLYYIGTDGVTVGGQLCEAGDMAIYYNNAWHVISGENQVSIVPAANNGVASVLLSGTASNLITVEGKTLALGVDYSALHDVVSVDKAGTEGLTVSGGKVNVAAKYIGLSQANGSTLDIAETVSFSLPTALASGAVTIDSVFQASDFTFTSGSFPTIAKNTETISVTASHSMSISKSGADGATGDYVTDVVAIKGVSFGAGSSTSAEDLAYVGSLAAASGKSFVSGIHAWREADADAVPAFTVYGSVNASAEDNTFVTGLSSVAAASGDVVSSVTVGTVSIADGAGILTGIDTSGSDFVSSISFGTAISDSANAWFYDGLTEGNDVVTAVDFGSTTLVADSSSNFAGSAVVAASVSNHVLSFSTGSFMTPVSVSVSGQGTTKAGFTKSGVSLSGFSYASKGFTTGSLSQADTTISYKSFVTAAVSLSQDSVKYYLDKEEEHAYAATMSYVKLNTTDATMSKNTPVLVNPDITAAIPANQVAVALSGGVLPTFSVGEATGSISGTVGTALASDTFSFLGIDSTKSATIPGAYTLVEDSATFTGAISVAEADQYDVTNATVAIPSGAFVSDVYVDSSAVSVNPGE